MGFTSDERARLLEYPTIVLGLIDGWPALRNWTDPRQFASRFGHHRVLARRVRFGIERAAQMGIDVDHASVSVAELVQRTESEHIIVLDEKAKGRSEEMLLRDLQHEYSLPEVFDAASHCRVFSFGGGSRGVQMMQHGAAWLSLVAGAKLWHLAPESAPRPSDRTCDGDGKIDYAKAKQEKARAAGFNLPAEVHAWGSNPPLIDVTRISADLVGAPKNASFTLPGAYKKDGCDLWRVDVRRTDLSREIVESSPYPFIIDGLSDNWTALEGWERANILREHGKAPFHLHSTYSRSLDELLTVEGQYHMGHAVYPHHACYSDPWRPYSPMLFGELSPSYHIPPYLHPMSTFQMGIGSGVGVGVPPENHPSSWFASVVGRKRWLLHPDSEREPAEAMGRRPGPGLCEPRKGLTSRTTLDCIQQPGEVIWVPNYWWHETCSLDRFSAGIGGITYKGCCDDLDRNTPPSTDCKRQSDGHSKMYSVHDIPYCKSEFCGTLGNL